MVPDAADHVTRHRGLGCGRGRARRCGGARNRPAPRVRAGRSFFGGRRPGRATAARRGRRSVAPGVVQRDLAAGGNGGRTVGPALPGDVARGVLADVLVLERGPCGQGHIKLSDGVARRVQLEGVGGVPTAQGRVVADDVVRRTARAPPALVPPRRGAKTSATARRSRQDGPRQGLSVSPAVTRLSRTGRPVRGREVQTRAPVPAPGLRTAVIPGGCGTRTRDGPTARRAGWRARCRSAPHRRGGRTPRREGARRP